MSLSKTELKLIAELLNEASDEFSGHCCNDYEIANTKEHRQLLIDAQNWNYPDKNDEDLKEQISEIKECKKKKLATQDSFLMDYLAARCKEEIK